jgi:hypothetical protein
MATDGGLRHPYIVHSNQIVAWRKENLYATCCLTHDHEPGTGRHQPRSHQGASPPLSAWNSPVSPS